MGSLPIIQIRADQGADRRGVIRFDLSDIPTEATVVSATLFLYPGNLQAEQVTYLYRITTDWAEETVTWNSPWTTPGGDFDSSIAYATFIPQRSYCYISIDLTALAQLWVTGQYPNYGVFLYSTGKNHTVEYASKEDSTPVVQSPRLAAIFTLP